MATGSNGSKENHVNAIRFASGPPVLYHKRMISKERGEAIARDHLCPFLETSAKTDRNIERAFTMLAEAILDKIVAVPDRKMSLKKSLSMDSKGSSTCC